jgi:hypothetical protein
MITLTSAQRLLLRRAANATVIPRGKQWGTAQALIDAGYLIQTDQGVEATDAGRQVIDDKA